MAIITVTAGHSNTDPGAVGNGLIEAKLAARLRNATVHYLDAAGLKVISDGTGLENQPLNQAIKLAKGASLAIEYHMNASANTSAKGIEVLSNPKDKKISQQIAKAIQSVTGSVLRGDSGWKPENSGQHSRLGFVQAGGLIVEVDFISNPTYAKIVDEKLWLIAQAVSEVIIKYVRG